MRKLKSIAVCALCLCLLLSIAGCAAAQRPLRVTLVLKTEDEPGFIDRLTNATDGALEPLRYEEFLRPWQEN